MTKEYIRKLFLYEDEEDIKEFIQKYFGGDINRSIEFMEKYNIFEEDENVRDWYYNSYPNAITLHLFNTNEKQALDLVLSSLIDVTEDNGRYWMRITSRENLASFFYDSNSARYTTAKDIAEKVLQEDSYEFLDYDDSMDTIDLINVLNSENLKELRQEFLKRNSKSNEFTLDDEPFEVTQENMDSITDGELSELVEQDLNLRNELNSLYNAAQEYAYSDELYEKVMGGLKDFFGTKDFLKESSVQVKRADDSVITRSKYEVDVSNIFVDAVVESLNQNLNYDEDVFGGKGYFETILMELMDDGDFNGGYINFSVPDYPNFSKTTQNMNDLFGDYI
jgi:hypothetical protein